MSNLSLYDLSAIRDLPILDVCSALGLDTEKHGKNFWCKVRSEEKASVILHTDSNTFYDFGNGRKGSVIDLVQYASSCSIGAAIGFLAKSFRIEPSMSRQDFVEKPLSNWEYQVIGLHGDLASKNIRFPIETASVNELADLSYAYRMPMNQLRKEDPVSYEAILRQTSVPYVNGLRNAYFQYVWNYYDFLTTYQNGYLFYTSDKLQEKFKNVKGSLERAERILTKAVYNTSISPPAPQNYDPLHVLSLIQQGRLAISIGTLDNQQLSAEAEFEGCCTKQYQVSYDDFYRLNLDAFRYSAVFNGNTVTLTCLEIDSDVISSHIDTILQLKKPSLDEKIASANSRKNLSVPCGTSITKEYSLS